MAENKNKYKQLQEPEYHKIKALCNAGLNDTQIVKIMERSKATISTVRRSTDFADYKRIVHTYSEQRMSYRQREEGKKIEEKIDTENASHPVVTKTHAGTEATSLLRIANALERLADAWEAQPNKSGFFKK